MSARKKSATKPVMFSLEIDLGPMLEQLSSEVSSALRHSIEYASENISLPDKVVAEIEKAVVKQLAEADIQKLIVSDAVRRAIGTKR